MTRQQLKGAEWVGNQPVCVSFIHVVLFQTLPDTHHFKLNEEEEYNFQENFNNLKNCLNQLIDRIKLEDLVND